MIVKIFSSLVDTSRRVPILLQISLLSALINFASFSKLFAKAFALNSTHFFAGAFLIGFFVTITRIGKSIKGCCGYI